MTFEIVFRKTFRTDEADPINQQSGERIVEWFVGRETQDEMWGLGFDVVVNQKP